MALFGTLADLPLPDLLHLLSGRRLSGRLTVTTHEGHGMVVLRDGKIIYAATNGARETFGSLLVHRNLITPSTLALALKRQAQSRKERRLGGILLEMGAVAQETLETLMHEQVGRVLEELVAWRNGFVRFEQLDILEQGEVGVDARDFVVPEGVETERMIFEVMTGSGAEGNEEDQLLLEALTGDRQPTSKGRGLSLKEVMQEIRCFQFTGEATLSVLRFAAHVLSRAAVFLHDSGAFTGIGQYGYETREGRCPVTDRERALRIPSDEPSIFFDVVGRREAYVGPLERQYWNVQLARQLGGEIPGEVAVVPLIVKDRVRLMLYGDNHPDDKPIEAVEELELLMLQAGLAVEKALLEKELREVRGSSGTAAVGF